MTHKDRIRLTGLLQNKNAAPNRAAFFIENISFRERFLQSEIQ